VKAGQGVVGVGDFVRRNNPRTHRAIPAPGFAQRELRSSSELQMAIADVLTDRQPGDPAIEYERGNR